MSSQTNKGAKIVNTHTTLSNSIVSTGLTSNHHQKDTIALNRNGSTLNNSNQQSSNQLNTLFNASMQKIKIEQQTAPLNQQQTQLTNQQPQTNHNSNQNTNHNVNLNNVNHNNAQSNPQNNHQNNHQQPSLLNLTASSLINSHLQLTSKSLNQTGQLNGNQHQAKTQTTNAPKCLCGF